MKLSALDLLRCPACRSVLIPKVDVQNGAEVRHGQLSCTSFHSYPEVFEWFEKAGLRGIQIVEPAVTVIGRNPASVVLEAPSAAAALGTPLAS